MDHTDNWRERLEALKHHAGLERRLCWWRGIAQAAALLGMLSVAISSHAADFSCASGDVACLIDAITRANGNGEPNTIRLEAGFYTLTSPFDPSLAVGLPPITSMLTIRGASGVTTVIERDPALVSQLPPFDSPLWFRLLIVESTGNLTLADLTLQNGSAPPWPRPGGAGAVVNRGVLTVVDSVIKRNNGGPANDSGAIVSSGTLTIVRSTITENAGPELIGGLALGGPTLILESAIVRNTALRGASAIYFSAPNASLIVQNSTIARNVSIFGGSAIQVGAGTATFINSTISENARGVALAGAVGSVSLLNTIVAGNESGGPGFMPGLGPDCAGITSFGHNLIGDPTGCTITLLPSDLTGDPGLGDFTDNGFPGNTHFSLLATSQAIDAGNDAVCPRIDQLGRRRVGPCDIGAIRFPEKREHPHEVDSPSHGRDQRR